jgi:hypothetical protein
MAIRERISILASKHVKLKDSVKLFLGDGTNAQDGDVGDISIAWDGTDLDVLQSTANSSIKLGVSGAGIDLQQYGDTVGADLLWDQSADSLIFGDNAKVVLGTGSDITVAWDGTDLDVTQGTVNSSIKWGVSGAGIDQVHYGDTAGADMTWDQSADSLIFGDNAKVVLGTGSDIVMAWDGTDMDVTQATANSSIKWGVDGAGIDHVFYGDTASASLTWDQSADELIMAGVAKLGSYRVKTVTATGSVSVNANQSGAYFYATGAATFTLPALADGLIFTFMNLTNADMAITSPGDNMIYNNDTFTTVTFNTANEKKGAMCQVVCNGTNYYLLDMSSSTFAVGGTGS